MKNRLFKSIAAVTLSAVSAFALAATGCGKHTHTWGDYISDGVNGHYRECIDGDKNTALEDHVFGNDDECDLCGYKKQSESNNPENKDPENKDPENKDPENKDPDNTDDEGRAPALVAGEIESVAEFVADDRETGTYSEAWTDGVFTIGANTEVRGRNRSKAYEGSTVVEADFSASKSVKINGDKAYFQVYAAAAGELVLYMDNGSSGTGTTQTLVMTKPDNTTQNIEYAWSNVQRVKITIEAKGTYKFMCTATTDIYAAKLTTKVQNTPIESISVVNKGKVDYLVGQQIDYSDIVVTATHATTGRVSPVEYKYLVIDDSNYKANQAGKYEISVSYAVAGNLDSETTSFTTKYEVSVYDYDSLELGFNKIVKGSKNTTAGNGTYENHAVRQFYFKGDTFSADGLSMKAIGKIGSATKAFFLNETQAQITGNDTSTTGEKTVNVAYTVNGVKKESNFKIYVAEKPADITTADQIELAVDADTAVADIGTMNVGGAYQFKTVQQALDFLNASGAKAAAHKIIYLAEGDYWEKLEITVPNLVIVGEGADKTKIEYDSLYGIADESGYVHVTDSTATMNVREAAVGFMIHGVTISNAYNSKEYFDEKLGPNYGEHRALAMLIQADQVVIDSCAILGYQDTIELFTGRQLITNTYISGTTDFIFGTNNTTYFYNCEIHSINTGKNDGGYITAFKGCNKGDTDYVTYGAIFDNCHFTADEGVVKKDDTKTPAVTTGNTAIARPWGAYAAVAVINSDLDGHISTKAASGASKNERYVSMSNGGDPTKTTTLKFVEYNNEGDGAIDSAVTGMKMLTADEAANYSNLAVVFGATNGKVTYSAAWDISLSDFED